MPEKPSRSQRPTGTSTPEDFPVSPSQVGYPSGDYSYTVELVGAIQNQLGKLTEAIDSLKETTKTQGGELRKISEDVHAAKVSLRISVGIILGFAALIAWVVNTYISATAGK